MKTKINKISVIGLGKLGLPLAACCAGRGFTTIGVDTDPHKRKAAAKRAPLSYEPGLKKMLKSGSKNLSVTSDCETAVLNSDATFILVLTPSDSRGGFSLKYVLRAAKDIAAALKKKKDYHLVVLTSTVMPYSTQNKLKPLLENLSGKRCGKDFGLCYNPEFIALGSVIHDLLNPDFILIGESDAKAGRLLADMYGRFCKNRPYAARMSYVNAELTKIAVNTYVTTKITFANTLARICEQLKGADVNVVTSALGLDSRIGKKYLKGAIGYGGPCFPRDNLALAFLARSLGAPATLAEVTDTFNRQQVLWMVKLIKNHLSKGKKVGMLGLAYKPQSDVVEESQGLLIAKALAKKNIKINVFDPAAMDNARSSLERSATFTHSAKECVKRSDIIIVATRWEEFKKLPSKIFARPNSNRVVIDCWGILKGLEKKKGITYIPLGIGGSSSNVNFPISTSK